MGRVVRLVISCEHGGNRIPAPTPSRDIAAALADGRSTSPLW